MTHRLPHFRLGFGGGVVGWTVMNKWTIWIILAGASLPMAADSLSGRVLDPQGAVAANADVTLLDKNSGERRKTSAQQSGEYRFDDVPAGAYLINAQSGNAALIATEEVTISGATSRDVTLAIARTMQPTMAARTSKRISCSMRRRRVVCFCAATKKRIAAQTTTR